MPNVSVGFDSTTKEFTFDPRELPVKFNPLIKFHRDPANAPWSFVRVDIQGVRWWHLNMGETFHVLDVGLSGTFPYTVTLLDANGVEHTSPAITKADPPIIKNEGFGLFGVLLRTISGLLQLIGALLRGNRPK